MNIHETTIELLKTHGFTFTSDYRGKRPFDNQSDLGSYSQNVVVTVNKHGSNENMAVSVEFDGLGVRTSRSVRYDSVDQINKQLVARIKRVARTAEKLAVHYNKENDRAVTKYQNALTALRAQGVTEEITMNDYTGNPIVHINGHELTVNVYSTTDMDKLTIAVKLGSYPTIEANIPVADAIRIVSTLAPAVDDFE